MSPLFGAPNGMTPLEFRRDLWPQKTRVTGHDVVCVILRLAMYGTAVFGDGVIYTHAEGKYCG